MPKMPETLGGRVFRLRQGTELTQAELAEKAGIDAGYLSRIERSSSYPTQEILEKLARALGVRAEELLQGTVKIHAGQPVICPNRQCPGEPYLFTGYIEDSGGKLHFIEGEERMKAYRGLRGGGGQVNWFCPLCGSFLIDKCLKCGRRIETLEASFCGSCGASLVSSNRELPPPQELVID